MTAVIVNDPQSERGRELPNTPPTQDQQGWLTIFDQLFAEDAEQLNTYRTYYDGDQGLTWNRDRFKQIFGADFDIKDNWCEVVVDAVADRLKVTGFNVARLEGDTADPAGPQGGGVPADSAPNSSEYANQPPGQPRVAQAPLPGEIPEPADPELDQYERKVSAIWQRNRMDGLQHALYVDAMVAGRSYLMVWPDPKNAKIARIYFNDADLIRCVYDENGDLMVAAKMWEMHDGTIRRNVYWPDRTEKYVLRTSQGAPLKRTATMKRVLPGTAGGGGLSWVRWIDTDDTSWPAPNTYGKIPIFPVVNKQHVSFYGQSEIKSVIPQQDAVNKLLADMMVASDYAAFTQKIMASKGRPKEGWKHGPNMVWSTTDTDAKWGQFDATPLENFKIAIEMLVQHVAGTSRTPQYMFFVTSQVPSGEAMKTAESGLTHKSERKQVTWGNSFEDAMRFACEIEMGEEFPEDVILTCDWEPVETRIEKEFWETQGLKKELGVSSRQLLMEGGYTPEQIAEFEATRQNESMQETANALLQAFESGTGAGADAPARPPDPPTVRDLVDRNNP